MLLKAMLRTMPGFGAGASVNRCGPAPIEIGPVTFFITRLENVIFSYRDPGAHRSLMGHPNVSEMMQFDTVIFSASPPPKRKTLQRVLKEQFVTVTNLQLPNSAHASS